MSADGHDAPSASDQILTFERRFPRPRRDIDYLFLMCSHIVMSAHTAQDVARGVSRLLMQEGFSPILEFTLANGRRLDVAALGPDGTMLGVEIKVAVPDLKSDQKWPDYLDFCELFYFAIPPDFPEELVPETTGLIVADRFGGAIVRPAPKAALHASRRKAVTLSFAKVAAERLASVIDLASDARAITVLPTEEA